MRSILVLITCCLAGCAAPYPPTVTSDDIAEFAITASEFAERPITPTAGLPSGRVRYEGTFAGDVRINGTNRYGLLGDLGLVANFSGGRVGGRLTDINLLEDGQPNQRLGGSMRINGTIDDGVIAARAEGNLSAVSDLYPVRGDADIALTLNGNVVSLPGGLTGVYGAVTGQSSPGGGFTLAVEEGQFFGTATPPPDTVIP